jgi:two-component system phosphate regulon sensor histidine kinase PhoR
VRGDDLPFDLRVSDEHGRVVWGPSNQQPLAARASLPMVFYPAQTVGSRLARGVEPVTWTVEVSPVRAGELLAVTGQGYWLPLLSIALMLVALAVTIHAGRRAARVAEMQAEFVAHVSHELKTPLSLISAATETVQLDRIQSPEKLTQYLGIIRAEVNRLSSLVQRVLEFSTVQRRLEFDRVDLGSLARETVEAFRASLEGQHFTFSFVQDGASPELDADPAALEQALANLLDNAVKYSGLHREVTVRVSTTGRTAFIDVIDRGIGVPFEDRSHIFEKFYRGRGDAHSRRGFGLGLAITRELIEAHGGRVDLVASGPHGSTFRISLPGASTRTRATAPARLELTS